MALTLRHSCQISHSPPCRATSNCVYIDTITDKNALLSHVDDDFSNGNPKMVWQSEVELIPAIVKQKIHLLLEYVRGSKDDKSPKAQSVERLLC